MILNTLIELFLWILLWFLLCFGTAYLTTKILIKRDKIKQLEGEQDGK